MRIKNLKLISSMSLLFFLATLFSLSSIQGDITVSDDDYYKIPISDLSNTIKFYTYTVYTKEVKFFAVIDSDGLARTAFDACDVCGGLKGYKQEGSDVVCNNCEQHFKIDSLGKTNISGGCYPSYLHYETDGEYILINKNDLINGRRFF